MTARDCFRKFCLMNWKNWKLQLGNPLQLLFTVLCPVMFTCIAVLMRVLIPMTLRTDKVYDPIDLTRSWLEMVEYLQKVRLVAKRHNVEGNPFAPNLVIGWAPQSYNIFREMMDQADKHFQPMELTGFDNCDILRVRMVQDTMFAGICFNAGKLLENYAFDEGKIRQGTKIDTLFNYSIIMPSELRHPDGNFFRANWFTLYENDPLTVVLQRLNQPADGGFVGYVREGFILMQKIISEIYLTIANDKPIPEVLLRRFPVLGTKEDPLMYELDSGLSLLILVGYLFPSLIFVWQIVSEKQDKLRLFLVNMSIGNIIQFLSWYITCLVCFLASCIFIVILLKVPWNLNDAVLTQTPWYILLAVIGAYCTVAASGVLMVSSFFTNPLTAVRVTMILWVFSYMPNLVLWNNLEIHVTALRYASYILPNVVLSMVFENLVDRESIVHSSSSTYSDHDDYRHGPLPASVAIWVFLITSLIFCVIGIYIEMWRMGDRSAKRVDKEENKKASNVPEEHHDWTESNKVRNIDVNSTKIYEVEPSNRRFKLKIKKLFKRFGAKSRPALNFLTWNVYENEVTVLMGHNGCGKSVLLNILAGLMEPTNGSVTVSNYNIQTERKAASMELGIALGTKMLLTGLTVKEHLRFICRVKGMHNELEIDGNVSYFMNSLQIDHLKNKRLRKLMKRDLALVSICCAFVGNSRIILIDDIHSDLDMPTKELIWALLNEEKSHCTIIVVVNTTALAESIADRLAIMSNGELKCTGTKPFLKNMYGHGFRLICVKGKNCKETELHELINSHMPNMTSESSIGYKVNFVLENKDEDLFAKVMDDLEENMERLDVVSFRIRDTSMEEIFLRFGCDEDDQMGGTLGWQENPNFLIDKYFNTLSEADNNKKLAGCGLWCLHLRAIAYKRWIVGFSHWGVVLLQLLAFIVAGLCSFCSVFIFGKHYKLVPLTFNLSSQHNIKAFVEVISDEGDLKELIAYYTELLYWYDATVLTVDKEHDSQPALLHHSDFARNVNLNFLFGATFDKGTVTAWFNNIPLHIAPYALNAVHNALVKNIYGEEADLDVTLETLPFQAKINIFPAGSQSFGVTMSTSICCMLCLIVPGLVFFFIRERASCMKKHQFLAGAQLFSFWAFTMLYDLFFVVLYVLAIIAMVACYHHPQHDMVFYGLLMACLVMSGTLVVLITYLVSGLCRNPIKGFVITCLINCPGFLIFGELYRHGFELPKWLNIWHQYLIGVLTLKLFLIYEFKLMCYDRKVEFTSVNIFHCKTIPNCCREGAYSVAEFGVVPDFIMLACWILIVGALLFLSEFHRLMGFDRCRAGSKDTVQPSSEPRSSGNLIRSKITDDPSAIVERERPHNLTPEQRSQKTVVAVGLVNKQGQVKVLKNVSFTLAKGESLNIAGLNDSGKSTLLKLIVREATLKSGQIWIQGYSLRRHPFKCYRMIGYCPQYDNLPAEFTPRQLLIIQALFHGHSKKAAWNITDALIRMIGIFQCCDRPVYTCTAGEERRLFYSLAILSSPQLVCLDGIPAGLDPIARRIINTVTCIMESMGSSFLFTNLTALDSERMCMRTPVMFDGELWMLSSIQKENENYTSGYQLEVRFKRKVNPNVSLSRSTWNRINHFPLSPHRKFTAFMEIKFPSARLRSQEESSMIFHIDVDSTTFSTIFLIIRKDAFEMNIEDYFITRNMRISHFAEKS